MPSVTGGSIAVYNPKGYQLVVTITTEAGATPTVYTTSALSGTHTMPKTITATTTFWLATEDRYTVSVTANGRECANTPDGTRVAHLVDGKGVVFRPSVDPSALTDLSSTYEASSSDRLTLGQSSMRRFDINSAAVAATTGVIRFSYFTSRKTETITQVRAITGSTAAAATPTLCKMGIWSVNTAGDLTLAAGTANDTTLFAATDTAYTRDLAVPLAVVRGQRYAFGTLVVSAGATPTFHGRLFTTNVAEHLIAPALCSTVGSQTDLATVLVGALSASGSMPYGVLLPA